MTDLNRCRHLPCFPCVLVMFLSFILSCAGIARGQAIPMPGQSQEGDQEAPGQGPNLKLGGYLENTLNAEYMQNGRSVTYLNNTRLRLNFSADLLDSMSFGSAVIAEANLGERRCLLSDYLPQEEKDTIPDELKTAYAEEIDRKDVYFQEAFLGFTRPSKSLRIGRFKFYSGTGYAYNPIDLFNRKDPLDPAYETRGQDAAMFSLGLSEVSELEITARMDEDHHHLDGQLRFKYYLEGWDLALQYTRYQKRRYDWSRGGRATDFTWNLFAFEFSGELSGIGIHGEGGYVFVHKPVDAGSIARAGMDHERFLIGLDYTTQSQLYVLLEYMRFGQGISDPDELTLNDRLAYLTGEIITSNKDTFYLGLSYPVTDLVDASLYSIVNANDPSVILSPWLVWDIWPGFKLSLMANLPLGREESSLGRMGASGFARLRFSF